MHRLTAATLLALLHVGLFAPAAMALSGPVAHACCLRRTHRGASSTPGFNATNTHNGNCCPPSVTPHCAELSYPGNDKAPNSTAPAQSSPHPRPFTFDIISGLPVRGPPTS